jgi:DNA sulfur modification protein DndC
MPVKTPSSVTTKEESVFDKRSLDDIYKEIQDVYLGDSRPWVVGYSGGKDSTATLQLIWYAISKLPPKQRKKQIFVISSDTLVETPVIVDYINTTLDKINEESKKQKLPFSAEKVVPVITESFWVNLIGRGYPAPQTGFRWCTERMKIKPADRFIKDKVSKFGEIITVLGIRKGESMTRDQVMNLYEIKGSVLSRHSRFPNAFVYTPVIDFSTNDIWTYLLQNPSPWGSDNRSLVALYKNAQAGECPLVVDDTTPSCGNTRFGCWVCTVVAHDRSMEALIDSGEEWMEPLLEIRDYLSSTQEPTIKKEVREFKRRMGYISIKNMYLKDRVKFENKKGEDLFSRGPYKLEICKKILSMLLQAQIKVRKSGPDPNVDLILPEEIHEIRRIWLTERGDWEDSIPKIYSETTGSNLKWDTDDTGLFGSKDAIILNETCEQHGVPQVLVQKLLEAERQTTGMNKRSSIFQRINQILAEEWRGEDEVKREVVEELTEKNIMSKKVRQQVIKESVKDNSTLDRNYN